MVKETYIQEVSKKLLYLEFADAAKRVEEWNYEMVREFKRFKFHRVLVHYLEEIFYQNLQTKPILKRRVTTTQIIFEYIYLWAGEEISVIRAHSLEYGLESPARYYLNELEFFDNNNIFEGDNFDRIVDVDEIFIPGVLAFYLMGI